MVSWRSLTRSSSAADQQAKPFHPVFLDVLETATTDIMHQREQGQHHDSWQNIVSIIFQTKINGVSDEYLSSILLDPVHSQTPFFDISLFNMV